MTHEDLPNQHDQMRAVLRAEIEEDAVFARGRDATVARDGKFTSPEAVASSRLRQAVHRQMRDELIQRIANNPTPTAEEVLMGWYVEGIEPQVRNAVLRMRAKGYQTRSSGFGPNGSYDQIEPGGQRLLRPHTQGIIITAFSPQDVTIEEIKSSDAEIIWSGEVSMGIGFESPTDDLSAILRKWDAVTEVLPDLGSPAPPLAREPGSIAFRTNMVDLGLSPDEILASPLAYPLPI